MTNQTGEANVYYNNIFFQKLNIRFSPYNNNDDIQNWNAAQLQNLEENSSETQEKYYYCVKCDFKSKYSGNLTKHKYLHTNIKKFKCNLCPYSTSRSDNLKIHKTKMHLNVNGAAPNPDIMNIVKMMYVCSCCDFQTDQEYLLDQHMFTHQESTTKKYKCTFCTFETNKKYHYKIHSMTHDTDQGIKYQCPLCDHQATRKNNLNQHMTTHKSSKDVTMYRCYLCPFESKYKKSLTKHVVRHRKETEKQWYQCDICSFRTFTKYSLKPHLLTHKPVGDIEMYECNFCHYKSKTRSNYTHHMKKRDERGFCKYSTIKADIDTMDDQAEEEEEWS